MIVDTDGIYWGYQLAIRTYGEKYYMSSCCLVHSKTYSVLYRIISPDFVDSFFGDYSPNASAWEFHIEVRLPTILRTIATSDQVTTVQNIVCGM